MGHSGEVGVFGDSADVFAEGDGEFVGLVVELEAVDHFPEGDHLSLGGWDFDSDGGFAGDGGFDAEVGRGEGEGDVVGEGFDAADFDSGAEGDLVAGDGGPGGDFGDVGFDVELFEGVFEDFDIFLDFSGVSFFGGCGFGEEVESGEHVAVAGAGGVGVVEDELGGRVEVAEDGSFFGGGGIFGVVGGVFSFEHFDDGFPAGGLEFFG